MTNQTFLHHLMMKECLPGPTRVITKRKLWGHHIHSLRDHIPIVFRIVPISSTMAENEERQFSTIKRITKTSANYSNQDHILTNAIIRQFYQQKIEPPHSNHQENRISQAAKTVSMDRTRIAIKLLKKYPREAQTWCERNPDFFFPGYGVHWHIEEDYVVLHDGPDDKHNPLHGPNLHHFSSTSLKQEHDFLQQKWMECIYKQVPMPLGILWIYEGQKLIKKVRTPYLDTDYNFTPQSHQNMPSCQDAESDAEEEGRCEAEMEGSESGDEDDPVIVRVERVDPEPDLEEEDTSADTTHMGSCVPVTPSQGCNMPDTPDKTPSSQASIPLQCHADHADTLAGIVSTPAKGSSSIVQSDVSTPPNTPVVPGEGRNGGTEWKTKLGRALAAVLGDVAIVQRLDNLKARLKTSGPHSRSLKVEYDTHIAKVSCNLSKLLHEDRENFQAWERSFMAEKGTLPTGTDVRDSEGALTKEKRIRLTEHLLRSLGVNLHMI
ncbi:uncharacterized protein [Branchiostoma lanceolatum]|uniref:uncharacterized protein n=1 Tax=Branchiostoma lanceolatum TaxID=7740 RepID=UPI0034565F2B